MTEAGFTLFDTPIGRCGLAWGKRGVVGVQLPEASALATRARLLERFPAAREAVPPAAVKRARDAIVGLLRGEARDLSTIALDMAGKIPRGATLSYGEVAARAGARRAARAVGQALRRNPFPIVVPCHRVLASGGKLGGYTANGGLSTKLHLLTIEGATPARK